MRTSTCIPGGTCDRAPSETRQPSRPRHSGGYLNPAEGRRGGGWLSTHVRQAIPHAGKDNHEPSPDRREYRERRGRGRHRHLRPASPPDLAPGQRAGGALAEHYDIPTVELRRRGIRWCIALGLLFSAAGLARHVLFFWSLTHYRALITTWTCAFMFSAIQ